MVYVYFYYVYKPHKYCCTAPQCRQSIPCNQKYTFFKYFLVGNLRYTDEGNSENHSIMFSVKLFKNLKYSRWQINIKMSRRGRRQFFHTCIEHFHLYAVWVAALSKYSQNLEKSIEGRPSCRQLYSILFLFLKLWTTTETFSFSQKLL